VIGFVLALAAAPYALVPPEQRPAFVKTAIEAVAAKDANRIAGSFREVVEVTDNSSHSIAAEQVIGMLSVCSQTDVHSLDHNVYVIKYECPSRRPTATGCDSGDLYLMVDGDRSSLAIAHTRKISEICRPSVPPPAPPPVDETIATNFAQALLHSDDAVVSRLVSDGTFVSSERRYPGTTTKEQKGNSKGLAELHRQYGAIISEIGQPSSVSCENQPLFEMCRFTYVEGGRVLLAFLNTKGSGMYLIHFVYATRP
jgi:hypothetical protein